MSVGSITVVVLLFALVGFALWRNFKKGTPHEAAGSAVDGVEPRKRERLEDRVGAGLGVLAERGAALDFHPCDAERRGERFD